MSLYSPFLALEPLLKGNSLSLASGVPHPTLSTRKYVPSSELIFISTDPTKMAAEGHRGCSVQSDHCSPGDNYRGCRGTSSP